MLQVVGLNSLKFDGDKLSGSNDDTELINLIIKLRLKDFKGYNNKIIFMINVLWLITFKNPLPHVLKSITH